jgi:hypothetical protein
MQVLGSWMQCPKLILCFAMADLLGCSRWVWFWCSFRLMLIERPACQCGLGHIPRVRRILLVSAFLLSIFLSSLPNPLTYLPANMSIFHVIMMCSVHYLGILTIYLFELIKHVHKQCYSKLLCISCVHLYRNDLPQLQHCLYEVVSHLWNTLCITYLSYSFNHVLNMRANSAYSCQLLLGSKPFFNLQTLRMHQLKGGKKKKFIYIYIYTHTYIFVYTII